MEESSDGMADTGKEEMTTPQKAKWDHFQMLIGAGKVKRWHCASIHQPQDVGNHTFGVMAVLLYITEGEVSKELLLAALMHDMAEGQTGDTPHPFKKQYPDEFNFLEDAAMESVFEYEQQLITIEEANLLKVADLLEMGIYASYEHAMGNTYSITILINVLKALSGLEIPKNAMTIATGFEQRVQIAMRAMKEGKQ